MLRSIKYPYLDGILHPFQVNITGASAGVGSINAPLISSVSVASSAADVVLKGGTPPRPLISVSTAVSAAAVDTAVYTNPYPSGTGLRTDIRDTSSNRLTGKVNILSLARYHKSDLRAFPLQSVQVRHLMPRVILARINADGTIASGKADIASVTKASSVYTITFKRAFARTPIVLATAINPSGAQRTAGVAAEGANQIQISTFNRTTPTDVAFCLVVVGSDNPTQSFTTTRTVKHSFILPRLEAVKLSAVAGTWSIDQGGGSLVKNATGDITYTYAKAFSRVPVIIGTGESHWLTLRDTPTAASARFVTSQSNSGNAVDSGATLFIFGWDSVTEV